MLDFKLMPRLKNIGSAKLYRPAAGEDENWPAGGPVLSTKTIDWELIAQQYDQIVKYTTALRLGTAEPEQGGGLGGGKDGLVRGGRSRSR